MHWNGKESKVMLYKKQPQNIRASLFLGKERNTSEGRKLAARTTRRSEAHGYGKRTSTIAIEKELKCKAGNDGTLSLYFSCHVVYFFNYV